VGETGPAPLGGTLLPLRTHRSLAQGTEKQTKLKHHGNRANHNFGVRQKTANVLAGWSGIDTGGDG